MILGIKEFNKSLKKAEKKLDKYDNEFFMSNASKIKQFADKVENSDLGMS